jgi:hypothetical protein
MSMRLKQRSLTEFLGAENVMPAEIHCRLQAVYCENTVNRTTVNCWVIKFRECEPGRANIVDQPCSGKDKLARAPGENGGVQDAKKDLHPRTGGDET